VIVVDLGCKSIEAERSIEPLVERFHPDILFGFDPHEMLEEGVSCLDGTVVVTRRLAAWTADGTLAFNFEGTRSRPDPDGAETVACFDFARWLGLLPPCELVLKADIEGAEVAVLEHLHRTGADRRVSLCLVEWHGAGVERTRSLIGRLACPVGAWPLA
jgi:hypothetical protein